MTPHRNSPLEVGIRELRDGLSSYLSLVKKGREIVVTDRGKPVARLVPRDRGDRLDELIARGLVTPPRRPKGRAPLASERIRVTGSVSDLVSEQRR